jgi:hypothetical protein
MISKEYISLPLDSQIGDDPSRIVFIGRTCRREEEGDDQEQRPAAT